MNEFEFYLLRFYRRPNNGWLIAVCEIQNFTNGNRWALFEFDYGSNKSSNETEA